MKNTNLDKKSTDIPDNSLTNPLLGGVEKFITIERIMKAVSIVLLANKLFIKYSFRVLITWNRLPTMRNMSEEQYPCTNMRRTLATLPTL